VITIGILAELPTAAQALRLMFFPPEGVEDFKDPIYLVPMVALLVIVVATVVAVTQAQRRIPVQYAQRAVGRKVYSGGSSFMPLRVNYAGVMPVIFAQAILMLPGMVFEFLGQQTGYGIFTDLAGALRMGSIPYLVLYGLLILFMSYFWVSTQFNEIQIADDLKKHGGYIPGVRPGQATSDFLHRTMSRITLAGAIFLTVVAVIPIILFDAMDIAMPVAQFFGGTSMLIIVGVTLDTMRQMESYLLMRHYDGFLKKGRIKGRF
jgi:preprotein translocase subunit SecY